jgi:hypothetical protein
MGSFITVIDSIIPVLLDNGPLAAFCQEKWNRSLSVEKVFKPVTHMASDLTIDF